MRPPALGAAVVAAGLALAALGAIAGSPWPLAAGLLLAGAAGAALALRAARRLPSADGAYAGFPWETSEPNAEEPERLLGAIADLDRDAPRRSR